MNIGERIRILRKENNMNQNEFGSQIGLASNTITNYETGRRNPSNQVIELICREFNVNENWLRYGEGEMFVTLPPEDEYIKAAAELSKDPEDEIIRQAIIEYWKLNEDGKRYLKEFLHNIANSIKKEE